jgi:hypothetical protein
MTDRRVALLGVLTAIALSSSAIAADPPRAVIELFTSQGCSSCPAADALLGKLSNDPSLIALSLAIDYWDYIGWKDTLALPGHANRQKAYSRVRGDRDVYTPQIVVSGAAQALGSDAADIERAIGLAKRNAATLATPVSLSIGNGQVTVAAPAGKTGGERGEVWLCPVSRKVTVAIGRGENAGRTLSYNNVVRRWIRIGEWAGAAQTWTVPLKDVQSDGVDQVAVIIQSGTAGSPGPMLAAALTRIP